MGKFKMFFVGDCYDWIKKTSANFKSKQISGVSYCMKSDSYKSFINKVKSYSYTKIGAIQAVGAVSSEPLPFENKDNGQFVKLKIGTIWAKNTFDCMWAHCTGQIKKSELNKNVKFKIDIGGEGLVYDKFGNVVQGITNFASDFAYDLGKPGKLIVGSEKLIDENGSFDFWVDCAANDLFGNFQENAKIRSLDVVVESEQIIALAFDLEVLLSACDYADKDRAEEIYSYLRKVRKACKFPLCEETALKCRNILKPLFESDIENNFEYTSIGHAHLDLAWLWPIRETKRKGLRTFATQIANMDKYPDYYFGASQAQLFDWIKNLDSDLFAKIGEKVKSGQLEVQGATWVEMDSNIPGLESLIRQFYYGKKYFQNEYGLDMKLLWLPDSFGYSSCLPQIMKLANVPYFVTQKLSWNSVTKFPYHTFNWVGIDGSEVFAHMLPNNTYNAPNNADNLIFGKNNFQEKDISNIALNLFGIGDGGAGPGVEHIERAKRLKNLAPIPKVKMGKAIDFFEKLVCDKDKFNKYQGELYLERHQGTYTTQARVKYYNRKCEFALRNYELLVGLTDMQHLPISLKQLEEYWKEVLLYQFHDVLPGSSIDRVYDECVPRYKHILDSLNNAINQILSNFAVKNGYFNPNSYDIEHYYQQDDKWYCTNLPKLAVTSALQAKQVSNLVNVSEDIIENSCIKIIFEKGQIKKYFDKKLNCDFVAKNGAFLKYNVYPDLGDCWDMKRNYAAIRKGLRLLRFEIKSDGVRAVAISEFAIRGVNVVQEVSLLGDEDFARVSIHIKNNRDRSMLRLKFESNIKADDCAFNTQCGHIYRRTTQNNKTEIAQYEVSGQKFVDLSDGNVGLAIINDCKYGFRCKDSCVDINLLRSPHHPAHNVDKGEFDVNLAIYTHFGKVNSEVYKRAYLINNPILNCNGNGELKLKNIEIDNQNVVVESIKIADKGGIVVRLYNSAESEQAVNVNMPSFAKSEIVNLLEDSINIVDGQIKLKPFEIANIRFFN